MKKLVLFMVLTACAAGVWAQDTLAFPNPRYWFRYNDTMQIFGTLGGMAECFYFYGIEYIPTEARTVYGISLWTSFIPEDMDLHVCAILMKRENGEYVRVDSVCTNNKEIAHYMEQAIPTCTSWNGGPDGAWKMVDYFFDTPHVVTDTFYVGFRYFYRSTNGENAWLNATYGEDYMKEHYPWLFYPELPQPQLFRLEGYGRNATLGCGNNTTFLFGEGIVGDTTNPFHWVYHNHYYTKFHGAVLPIVMPPDSCPGIANFRVEGLDGGGCLFVWQNNSEYRSFQFAYGELGTEPDSCRAIALAANSYVMPPEDMTAGSTYVAYVKAECEASGHSVWTDWRGPLYFSRGGEIYHCPKVENLHVERGADGFVFRWTYAGTHQIRYEFVYGLDGTSPEDCTPLNYYYYSSAECTLSYDSINPNRRYVGYVRSLCEFYDELNHDTTLRWSEWSDPVRFRFDGGQGIESAGKNGEPGIALKPNPARGTVQVVNAEDGKEVGEVDAVSLYSMAGEKMAEVRGGATIDVTTLPAAVYMVRVELRNGDIRYLKLVKE